MLTKINATMAFHSERELSTTHCPAQYLSIHNVQAITVIIFLYGMTFHHTNFLKSNKDNVGFYSNSSTCRTAPLPPPKKNMLNFFSLWQSSQIFQGKTFSCLEKLFAVSNNKDFLKSYSKEKLNGYKLTLMFAYEEQWQQFTRLMEVNANTDEGLMTKIQM